MRYKFLRHLVVIGNLWILSTICVYSQQTITQWMNTAQQRIDTLRKGNFTIIVYDKDGNILNDSISIKLKKHEFVFGCANDFLSYNYSSDPLLPSVNDWIKANILKYFNFNVTGNAYKWSGTQPYNATTYNYGPVDSVVKWSDRAKLNNLKGHTLIWGANNDSDYHCIPKWVMNLPTNKDIYNACETRVRSMVSHYKGKFKEIDVLNEPIHALWLKNKLGTDSIYWNVFKWAKQEDPSAKLYINDYNVEYNWGNSAEYKALIKKMISKGAPVEGIGIQAHFWTGDINLAELKQNMDTLAKLGLPMKFTEFDLDSMSQLKQATNTASAYRFAFSHPSFTGIISWGFWDIGAWRKNSGYFDLNKNPKLAADTIYNLLHKIWTTQLKTKTNGSGLIFKGYYGQYDVKAKFGNTWKQFTIDCNKAYKDSVFVLKEQSSAAVCPQFISAKMISKTQMLLKFDKKMSNPVPSIRAFKVFQINPLKIDSISLYKGDSTLIYIKLVSNINTNPVMVFYSDGTLKSADGGILEAFGPEKINNNYVALNSSVTSKDGKTIEATFNKPVNNPATQVASFRILVNRTQVSIDSIRLKSGNDSVMIFSLSVPILGGDTVLLNYTPGTVTSKDGFDLVSFSNYKVTNIVPQFLFVSATNTKTGKTIEARFNMPVSVSTANASDFVAKISGVAVNIDSFDVKSTNDSILTLYLNKAAKNKEIISLTYTKGSLSSVDGLKAASFSNYTVTNVVQALTLVSASTFNDNKTIIAVFNKSMADPSALLSQFRIYVNSTLITVDSVRLKKGNDSIMVFTLRNAVLSTDAIQFFYYAGTVATVDGEKLATIRFFNVTNNVTTATKVLNYANIRIYPNPANEFIFITGNTIFNRIKIYSSTGKLIMVKELKSTEEPIDVSFLPKGLYFMNVFKKNEWVSKIRFIKN